VFTWKQTWLQGSFARAILLTSLVVSTVPIALFSILSIRQNTEVLTEQTQTNLQTIVEARAATIDLKLKETLDTTRIAAHGVDDLLHEERTSDQIQEQMTRYQPDSRNILGLDVYYNSHDSQAFLGNNLSNVYWNNRTSMNDAVAHEIIQTEKMDPLFESIKQVSPDTQWIYFTTPDGMMRLYPWASNDHYPDNWDPRETLFYTIAQPATNPSLQPRWTPPYVDFAGAGWMVTLSIPVIDKESKFQGIMSQDITISSLKEIALNINILDGAGYGFLIDKNGGVIAHPDFQPADANKGTQGNTNLLHVGSDSFRSVIQQMVDGKKGFGYFMDEQQQEQLLVYTPVSSIGWSLGVVVPRIKVLDLATSMRNRGILITVLMIIAAAFVSVLFTRLIHAPLIQLMQGVHHLSEDEETKEFRAIEVKSFTEINHLAQSFNEMAAKVRARETKLKAKVSEMRIEIDSRRKEAQVDALVESDYFKQLEINAERLRNKLKKQ